MGEERKKGKGRGGRRGKSGERRAKGGGKRGEEKVKVSAGREEMMQGGSWYMKFLEETGGILKYETRRTDGRE